MWQYIQHNIDSKLHVVMNTLYKKINKKIDDLTQQVHAHK